MQHEIKAVLDSLAGHARSEAIEAVRAVIDEQWVADGIAALLTGNAEEFYFSHTYKREQITTGVISLAYPGVNSNALHVIKNLGFYRVQFKQLVSRFEGSACCADKSRWILNQIIKHYRDGTLIEIPAGDERSYCHPEYMFSTHECVMRAVHAMARLYHGHVDEYLKLIAHIEDLRS